jgi:hypothetical protein
VETCAGTDGLCGVGVVFRPRSSVDVAVCWHASSDSCVRPCALRDHTHAFVDVKYGKAEGCGRGDLVQCKL